MNNNQRRYYCHNLNGSITGRADVEKTPEGYTVSWSMGSPWAGGFCDDGPSGEGKFPTLERAEQYLRSHGFEA